MSAYRAPAAALAAVALAMLLGACGGSDTAPLPSPPTGVAPITVVSSQLTNGLIIRPRYTCDGLNLSPGLAWSGLPADAVSTVLIVDDPDAAGGAFTHWLVYDLPASVTTLIEGIGGPFDTLRDLGGRQGNSDFGPQGYSGPCPRPGSVHNYVVHVYALDVELGLEARVPRNDVVDAMEGHIVGHGTLTGAYARIVREEESVVFKPTPTHDGS